jgi:hypothetical protein
MRFRTEISSYHTIACILYCECVNTIMYVSVESIFSVLYGIVFRAVSTL